jgi:hypothetical protein
MKDCVMTFIKHNYELCLNYISWGQTLNHLGSWEVVFLWCVKNQICEQNCIMVRNKAKNFQTIFIMPSNMGKLIWSSLGILRLLIFYQHGDLLSVRLFVLSAMIFDDTPPTINCYGIWQGRTVWICARLVSGCNLNQSCS